LQTNLLQLAEVNGRTRLQRLDTAGQDHQTDQLPKLFQCAVCPVAAVLASVYLAELWLSCIGLPETSSGSKFQRLD
jgi:hypothetical protein